MKEFIYEGNHFLRILSDNQKNLPLSPLSFCSFESSSIFWDFLRLTITFRGFGGTAGFFVGLCWGELYFLGLVNFIKNSGFCTFFGDDSDGLANGLGANNNLEGSFVDFLGGFGPLRKLGDDLLGELGLFLDPFLFKLDCWDISRTRLLTRPGLPLVLLKMTGIIWINL